MVKEYLIDGQIIKIQEGDCFLVRNKKIYNVATLLGAAIRGVLDTEYNHFSMVVKYNDDLWILEAIGKGVIVTEKLDTYIMNRGRQLKVLAWNINLITFREGVDLVTGKKYDLFNVLVLQFLRVMLAKIGITYKIKSKNQDRRFFCTEAGGIVMGLENWYEMTPKDFDKMYNYKYILYEGKDNLIKINNNNNNIKEEQEND